MFNLASLPTFATVFMLWVLAVYIGTRGPRTLVSLAVVLTQIAAAAYLFGQAMLANSASLEEWRAWARALQWGVALGPALWFALTALLLRENPKTRGYLRAVGYPLGALIAITAVGLLIAIYGGDLLYRWSAPITLAPGDTQYFRFRALPGPFYLVLVGFLATTTGGSVANAWAGWRGAPDETVRRYFRWLLIGAGLISIGTIPTAIANWQIISGWPTWLGHLSLAIGQVVLVIDIAAYSFFLHGRVLRTDLFAFVWSMTALGAIYLGAVALLGPPYSFRGLLLLALLPLLAVLTHAASDLARRILDRLFFAEDVRQLRGQMAAIVQEAGTTPDLHALVSQAQTDLRTTQVEHDARLIGQALRRLNSPASLSRCELIERLPVTLRRATPASAIHEPLPLEQARLLRHVLIEAIARLNPSSGRTEINADHSLPSPPLDSAGTLQYNILHDEYVHGIPNKQIMRTYAISEGTFHRHRRAAIAAVAQDLFAREAAAASSEGSARQGADDPRPSRGGGPG